MPPLASMSCKMSGGVDGPLTASASFLDRTFGDVSTRLVPPLFPLDVLKSHQHQLRAYQRPDVQQPRIQARDQNNDRLNRFALGVGLTPQPHDLVHLRELR